MLYAHGLQMENGNLWAAGGANAHAGRRKCRIASGIGSRQWQAIELLGGKAVGCPESAKAAEVVIERAVLLHQDDDVIDLGKVFWAWVQRRGHALATAKERRGDACKRKQPGAPR